MDGTDVYMLVRNPSMVEIPFNQPIFSLGSLCPSPPTQSSRPKRWEQVTLLTPWIAEVDQAELFKDNVTFATPEEQARSRTEIASRISNHDFTVWGLYRC